MLQIVLGNKSNQAEIKGKIHPKLYLQTEAMHVEHSGYILLLSDEFHYQ